MNWAKIRFYIYVAVPIVIIPLIGGLVFYQQCSSFPDATQQIGVEAQDFKEPATEAMRILNGAAGCTIFVPGKDLLFLSTDGEPCNVPFHKLESDGHSAGAYRCLPNHPRYRGYQWEVHVWKPGNLRTQTCIAIHEFLHVAGFDDSPDKSKAMHTEWCPPDGKILWPADSESKKLNKDFCP